MCKSHPHLPLLVSMNGNKNEEQPFLHIRNNDNAPNPKPSSYKSIPVSPTSESDETSKDASNKKHQDIDIGSVSITLLTIW